MRETVSGPEELNMVIVCQREEVSPTLCCCMPLDKSNTRAWVYTVYILTYIYVERRIFNEFPTIFNCTKTTQVNWHKNITFTYIFLRGHG